MYNVYYLGTITKYDACSWGMWCLVIQLVLYVDNVEHSEEPGRSSICIQSKNNNIRNKKENIYIFVAKTDIELNYNLDANRLQ